MTARQQLFSRYLPSIKPGRLDWIGVRPARRENLLVVERAIALPGLGLEGDHRCAGSPLSARQVTLINAEHIQVVASLLGLTSIDPGLLRRNLVVSGINLLALRHQQFRIGDVLLEATALCHPCSRMDEMLGNGGTAAMLGHGGLCAKILEGGELNVGDAVVPVIG
ncbi:MOSC domain-containing protein [Parathalassolituus penaei]|uniref:MOSC domain-containing protein n=1 Tax=Parathalassolituus penaei TaxID=2997323 RepID=A0A9X3ECW5_9GAMM|nr:MOSC domain-containing protein [Parathalassolituus penaei]MCY0965264.1 MOSC domain-containing protein [Parathalassolituus penaei]